MLPTTRLSLLATSVLFLTTSMGFASQHAFISNIKMDFNLTINEPEVFTNPLFWEINARCVIETPDALNSIHVRGLSQATSTLNDRPIDKDSEFDLMVQNNDTLVLNAKAGAQVELTNKGPNTIKAHCQTL